MKVRFFMIPCPRMFLLKFTDKQRSAENMVRCSTA